MTEEQQSNPQELQPNPQQQVDDTIECSLCGRVGGPVVGCKFGCNGQPRFVQKRQYTMSEERRGFNPDAHKKRYGLGGEVGPKQVHSDIVLPKTDRD